MKDKLIIPKTIHVGLQRRSDTYTGKLAYVIYEDHEGKLKCENSWNRWRNQGLGTKKLANEPIEGFVLNKKVGDKSGGWRSGMRKAWFRTYDPRGFEIEIDAGNLVFILQECTSVKGKGLEGKFIYAWDRQKLILLPVDSEEYRSSVEHTRLRSCTLTVDDLVEGCLYRTKAGEEVMYLGLHPYYHTSQKGSYERPGDWGSRYTFRTVHHKAKRHIFAGTSNTTLFRVPKQWGEQSIYLVGTKADIIKKLAERLTEEPSSDYADTYDAFAQTKWGKKPDAPSPKASHKP